MTLITSKAQVVRCLHLLSHLWRLHLLTRMQPTAMTSRQPGLLNRTKKLLVSGLSSSISDLQMFQVNVANVNGNTEAVFIREMRISAVSRVALARCSITLRTILTGLAVEGAVCASTHCFLRRTPDAYEKRWSVKRKPSSVRTRNRGSLSSFQPMPMVPGGPLEGS